MNKSLKIIKGFNSGYFFMLINDQRQAAAN